ncbi:synthase [Musa troglodytarum]|uniref:Synthase n=1 Tax=Musa troglodytarum TaxID=320322 RepID=A0A9E7I5J5_9LILI|nr:synthase [Musa troglodytarum]
MRYVGGIQLNRVSSSAASIYGRRVVGDLLRDPGPGVPSCLFGQGFGRGFPGVAIADGAFWEDALGLCRTCLTSSRRRPTGAGHRALPSPHSLIASCCGSYSTPRRQFKYVVDAPSTNRRPVYVLIKVINDDEQENHVIFMYPIMGWVCEVHGAVAPSWTSVM